MKKVFFFLFAGATLLIGALVLFRPQQTQAPRFQDPNSALNQGEAQYLTIDFSLPPAAIKLIKGEVDIDLAVGPIGDNVKVFNGLPAAKGKLKDGTITANFQISPLFASRNVTVSGNLLLSAKIITPDFLLGTPIWTLTTEQVLGRSLKMPFANLLQFGRNEKCAPPTKGPINFEIFLEDKFKQLVSDSDNFVVRLTEYTSPESARRTVPTFSTFHNLAQASFTGKQLRDSGFKYSVSLSTNRPSVSATRARTWISSLTNCPNGIDSPGCVVPNFMPSTNTQMAYALIWEDRKHPTIFCPGTTYKAKMEIFDSSKLPR